MSPAYFYFFISALVNAIISTILGLFVYFHNRKNMTNQTLALFCFGVALWSYPYILWPVATTLAKTLLSFQLLHIGACFVSIFYFHFVVTWLGLIQEKKKIIIIGYITSFIFACTTFTPYFIRDMVPKFNMRYWAEPGIIYHFFLINFFFFAAYASYLLLQKYRRSIGSERKQTLLLLVGILMAFIGGSTNYFLWYNINIPPYGNGLVVLYVILTVYAIVKHRFLDIKLVLRKSVVYVLSLVTIVIPLIMIKFLVEKRTPLTTQADWLNIITFLGALFLFPYIRGYYYRVANKYFFSSLYDPQKILATVNEGLKTTLDTEKTYKLTSDALISAFHCKHVCFLLYNQAKEQYVVKFNIGFDVTINKKFDANRIIHKLFVNRNVFSLEELKDAPEANTKAAKETIALFEHYNIEILVPLQLKSKVIGLLVLGPKESNEDYNTEDIKLLDMLNTEVAISIENSLLYEETLKFNTTLKRRIDEATEKLKLQNKELQKIDAMKTEFVSVASHQLRTPLTSTKWALLALRKNLLKSTFDIKEAKDTVLDLASANHRLIKLVNDLLNISRIDEGRLKIEPVPTDIVGLMKSTIQDVVTLIKRKHIEIIEKHEKLPKINLDPSIFGKALANIISNSIKYNRKGKKLFITIKQDHANALIIIKDQGIGIPAIEQVNIFKKFFRASNATTSNTSGTGLGLYITKSAIEKSGGKVWFESVESEGTTFYISIPLVGSTKIEGEKSLI